MEVRYQLRYSPVSPIPASLDRISIPAARTRSHQPGPKPLPRRRPRWLKVQADGAGQAGEQTAVRTAWIMRRM